MAGRPKTRARKLAQQEAAMRGDTVPAQPEQQRNVWSGKPKEPPKPRVDVKVDAISGDGVYAAAEQVEKPELFTELLGLSLEKAISIMKIELDPDHREYGRVLSLQQSIANGVFSVTARIAQGTLRKKEEDGMGALLDEIRKQSSEQPVERETEEVDQDDELSAFL